MVFFMSITVFIITSSIYASKSAGGDFSFWQYIETTSLSNKKGLIYQDFTYKTHTNWLGMIALGNSVASLVGFFLFKDKK